MCDEAMSAAAICLFKCIRIHLAVTPIKLSHLCDWCSVPVHLEVMLQDNKGIQMEWMVQCTLALCFHKPFLQNSNLFLIIRNKYKLETRPAFLEPSDIKSLLLHNLAH